MPGCNPGGQPKGVVRLKKSKWVRFLPVLALLAALLCLPVQAAGAPRAVLNAKDGVVRIFCEVDGDVVSGSGFLVTNTNSGTVVVTNYHVVQGASEMELYYDGNGPVDLTVMAISEGQDLCLMQTPEALPGMAPLTLADKVEIGDAVYALGYPGGSDVFSSDLALTKDKMALTSGLVSALTSTDLLGDQSQPVQLVQTNADINHGNSGGPLLNEQGQVIGVNTLALNDFGIAGVNAAIHVDELSDFLQAQGVAVGRGGSSKVLLGAVVLLSVLLVALLVLVFFLIQNEKKAAARRAAQQMDAAGYPGPAAPVQVQAAVVGPAPQTAYNGGPSPTVPAAVMPPAPGTPIAAVAPQAVPPAAQTTVQTVPHPAPPAAAPQEANGMQVQGQQTGSEAAYSQAATPAYPAPAAVSAPLPTGDSPAAQQAASGVQTQGQPGGWAAENAARPSAFAAAGAQQPAVSAPVPPSMTAAQATNNGQPQGQQTGFGATGIPAAVTSVYTPAVSAPVPPGIPSASSAMPPIGIAPVQNTVPPVPPAPMSQPAPMPPQSSAPPPPVWPVGNTAQPAAPAPKKKLRVWPIVTAIALCLVLALGITAVVGISAYNSIISRVDTAMAVEDYETVLEMYDQNPWLGKVRDEAEQQYSAGMLLITQGKYKDGAAMLSPLGDYKDAAKAAAYAKAIIAEDPYEQYLQFKELGDYRDSLTRIDQAKQKVFKEAKKLIEQGEFTKAKTYLGSLPNDYPYREDYLNLLSESEKATISPAYMRIFAEDCTKHALKIPPMMGEEYIDFFMAGYWETENGWYFHWYNDDDQLSGAHGDWHFDTNIGFQYYSLLYTGDNGLYQYENDTQPVVRFEIVNYYEVIAYYGSGAYYLYRY